MLPPQSTESSVFHIVHSRFSNLFTRCGECETIPAWSHKQSQCSLLKTRTDWLRETLAQAEHLRIFEPRALTDDASTLGSFLAERAGAKVGYALVRIENDELEVVALEALTRRRGIGVPLCSLPQRTRPEGPAAPVPGS